MIAEGLKEMWILYLDDVDNDLENFKRKVNKYNTNLDNDDSIKIRLETCSSYEDAISIIEKSSIDFDVFICDHNMPDRMGLDLIKKYVKPAHPDMTYVLYSGAGNQTSAVRGECINNDILYFEKTEQFSTLIGQIVNKAHNKGSGRRSVNNPWERIYYKLTNEIIEEMHQIEKFDPDFQIELGERVLTPAQLINELNNRTSLGFEYIEAYIDGLKFFNK